MHSLENILGPVNPFLSKIFKQLQKDKIDVSNYKLDHICYRTETLDSYEQLKQKILNISCLLAENKISNRPISIFKMEQPIIFADRKISYIELIAPRKDVFFVGNYEHVEFVIDLKFEDFIKLYPKIKFNTSLITRKNNPELIINYKNFAVKFHHQPITDII